MSTNMLSNRVKEISADYEAAKLEAGDRRNNLNPFYVIAEVGKNLVWGHTDDGIPRWIWLE